MFFFDAKGAASEFYFNALSFFYVLFLFFLAAFSSKALRMEMR